MQYELQTTVGVDLAPNQTLHDVRQRLQSALSRAVAEPGFEQIAAYQVTFGERDNELVIGILFREGVRAQYIEDIGSDLFDTATAFFVLGVDSPKVSEESVRLQSVFA